MEIRKLPPELISLVHHIELNKAGWWDKGVEQLLITTIWLSGQSQSIEEIRVGLTTAFQIDLDLNKVQAHLDKLCRKSVLVCMPDGRFRISESFLKKYEVEIKEAETLEKDVEESFVKLIGSHCPSLDPKQTWREFDERFLLPLVKEVGANTYRLLSEGGLNISPARFERFIKAYPKEVHAGFGDAVEAFLDPKNGKLRTYVLRSLNAYFFIEASSLTESTLEGLKKFAGSQPSFSILVDTNFLFAILELIPSAGDGRSLVDLMKQLKNKIKVQLYALPTTLDEAKRKLIATKQHLSGVRTAPNIVEAALRMKLDGLHLKFFEESRDHGPISAEDYFEPYISDLVSIMRTAGVELYNEDVDAYKTKQAVIDDIMSQLKMEQKRYEHRAKNYDRLEHDMILWHFVRDKRGRRIESPLEAKYWLLTIDYRMLGFDKFKRRISRRRGRDNIIPICVYPTTLVQMLQFWIPRTPQFEEAMLSSMRLPFMYRDFDPVAERVTLDILKVVSRYENVGDLGTETVSSILVNSALRQKMAATKDVEKKASLVRDALIEQHREAERQMIAMSERLQSKEAELYVQVAAREAQERQVADRDKDIEGLEERLRQTQLTSETDKAALSARIGELEQASTATLQLRVIRREQFLFLLRSVFVPFVVLSLMVVGLSILNLKFLHWNTWRTTLSTSCISLLLLALVIDLKGVRNEHVKNHSFFRMFQHFRKWIFALVGVILAGLLGDFIYDWLKTNYL